MLDGKVYVVTGGAAGIGEACARAISASGGHVVIGDLDLDSAEQLAAELSDNGQKAIGVRCDVAREEDLEQLIRTATSAFGRLDGAVNNAGGVPPRAEIAAAEWSVWRHHVDVHLFGTVFAMKHEIRAIRATSKTGAIVNMSSRAGLDGVREIGPYVASKWAILGVTKTAALECAEENIRVNAICPGLIATPMVRRQIGAMDPKDAAGAPMCRAGEPSEIASAALWFLSPGSSYVTGTHLSVDGGIMAGPVGIRPASGGS
ncbi:SDR family oxidoreductase (plasmid) [Sphingobium sp. JS3065]|uniref:SDR family NAD(P)-dependent oxidoreductase n=1 Tax=Sphingobium sp. JS3065 TaxID=2970925 RepID=UPI0022644DEC|nr:SDR family NAD(P)-dependent oxidoreductase [Sphingobium sp. JS3065]UZW58274.1 SDR family oxidoreductase [Sphingobium sp. JS3065]